MTELFSFKSPRLTWRDVQHLIAITSEKTHGEGDVWRRNGAGLEFCLKCGFGNINAEKIVEKGKYWINLPPQQKDMFSIIR
jgi:hypothetical protein